MAEYVYAKVLAWDERTRYGRDELNRMEAEHIRLEGRPLDGPWAFSTTLSPLMRICNREASGRIACLQK